VATTENELIGAVRAAPDPLVLLAGGSNVVIGDAGVPGPVVLIRTRGVEVTDRIVTVAAGEPWDGVCAALVEAGFAGLECLSGIPGSAGATPIQNVGAYGQEVAETIVGVRVYDRVLDEVRTMTPPECGFGYRTSVFKHDSRRVVLSVDFALTEDRLSKPVRYAELARTLGVEPGGRAPLAQVRAAVLELRAGKGMVLDPDDPDTWSVGSFFTNPVLTPAEHAAFAERAEAAGVGLPVSWPVAGGDSSGLVKISAAWLIEHAGFGKGHRLPGPVGLSRKHTLALTHRGGGSTAELLALAREIQTGVLDRFRVRLEPEPVLVNCSL